MMRRTKYVILAAALFAMMILVNIPINGDAQSPSAVVKVECPGGYWGTIKGDDTVYVEHVGTNEFQVSGDIIYVVLTKANQDDSELKATILVDGNERISKSTTEPGGELRFSYSLGAEGSNGDGEEEDNDDENGGFFCGSTLSLSIVLLLASVLIAARIKKK